MKNMATVSGQDFFNRDRHLSDEGVALYVDALNLGKEDQLPEKIVAHVEDCPTCKAAIFELHEVMPEPNDAEYGPHPFFEPKPVPKTWADNGLLRLAAVLVLGVGMTYLVYTRIFNKGPKTQITVTQPQTPDTTAQLPAPQIDLPVPQPSDLYAANFSPSANLEDWLDAELRAATLEILAPKNSSDVRGEIIFQWQGEPPAGLQLKILNNREDALFTFTATGTQLVFKEALPPGLYYWKLETAEELLHVGKFYVGRRQ